MRFAKPSFTSLCGLLSIIVPSLLIFLAKPTPLVISLFIFFTGAALHFVSRIFLSFRPNFWSHFGLIYLPLALSYFLFLSWQGILEAFLFLPLILVILIGELGLRTLGV